MINLMNNAAFIEDVCRSDGNTTTNVPPSQPTETAGLMTSPQNMEKFRATLIHKALNPRGKNNGRRKKSF